MISHTATHIMGEHTTTVDGNGRNPGKKELLAVGTMAGIKKRTLYGYHN